MRFIADGPDIPEELLVARDRGDVIFFCGAGVSQANARLPNFEDLGRDVIRILGAAQDSPARLLLDKAVAMGRMAGVGGLVATDRIFGLLEREFEVRDVREAVAEAIRPPDAYGLEAHRVLLDLATTRTGITRLVTTNFDNLFEECAPELPTWGPPRLPDPRSDREFRGIVHLHGRVGSEYARPLDDEFVVSSADYGRAYLSDGWATRFIQSLLTRYQIVFVGYTADDPPVQYLLEALNLHAGTRARLFAFQPGDAGEATALWEHRGVQAIPFDDSQGFDPLWRSLDAWAERARDVDGWYRKVIQKADAGPAAADPHFRGIVAKMAGTSEGAHHIATAPQTVDARWLLAFDPAQRYAPPGRIEPYDDTTEMFDPFEALGLDCDEAPDPPNPGDPYARRSKPEDAFDALARNHFDDEDRGREDIGALRGLQSSAAAAMPPRLASLGVWLNRIAHEPIALWWAAQQNNLHPNIQRHIESSLRQSPERFPEAVRKGWQWLFAAWADQRDHPDEVHFTLEARAERNGWSLSLVRDMAALYRPRLTIERPLGTRHPFHWKDAVPERLVAVDVDYPRPHAPLTIPDEFVTYAVTQFRQNLELGVALEREVTGGDYLYFTTTRAADGQALDEDSYGLTGPIILFQTLMVRLSAVDRGAARAEVVRWPKDDEYVFARLRIWAAGMRDLLDGVDAADIFVGLPESVFWGSLHERDLLYALRDRWEDLPDQDREAVETRLRTGSFPYDEDVRGGAARAAAYHRLNRLFWLSSQGIVFTFDVEAEMAALRTIAPEWTPEIGAEAAASDAPEVFTVETDDAADPLVDVPLGEILARADETGEMHFRDRVQREPFQGLAKRLPVRAFLALVHAARRGEAPRRAWADFLSSEARKADRVRMISAISARLCGLPIDRFCEIAYPVSEWMRDIADRLFGDASTSLGPLWSRMMEALSLQGTTKDHRPDHSWANDALNAPVGKLVDVLMKDPAKNGLTAGSGYPRSWRDRVDELLNLPGDLRRQALVMMSFQTTWLSTIDPQWAERILVPAAADEGADGDAFWDGFLWAARTPPKEFYLKIKSALLARVLRRQRSRQHSNILAGILLAGWGGAADADEPERLISDIEFREVLIHADDDLRRQVIRNLERWAAGDQGRWRDRVLLFLRDVWPKQRVLRTPGVSERLAELALSSGDLMPEVVAMILPRLVPIRGTSFHGLGLRSRDADFPARRHPKAMLDLLEIILPEDPRTWPYKIEDVFQILEESPDTSEDPRLADLQRRAAQRL